MFVATNCGFWQAVCGHNAVRTLVNDALKADDGEQSAGDGGCSNGAQDDQTEQATGVAARLALEEEVGTARGRDFGGHGGGAGGEGVCLAVGGWWWH